MKQKKSTIKSSLHIQFSDDVNYSKCHLLLVQFWVKFQKISTLTSVETSPST